MYCALIDGFPEFIHVYYLPLNFNLGLVDAEIVLKQHLHLSSDNLNYPLRLIHNTVHISYTSDGDIILKIELRNKKFRRL